jgi:hypothetical protein
MGYLFTHFSYNPSAMTHQHFKSLSKKKKYRNLLLNGVCLASRDTEENCILLFQLGDFYVEIYFDKNCDEIIHSRSFKEIDELNPYLERIDISNII